MNNSDAFNEITNTYDTEDMQEIVNYGCQSGVCHKHIYYADTISFFDKYEDEIYSELTDCYGVDALVELFKEADALFTHYKNSVVWLYIEHVCSIVLTTLEEEEYAQDQMIEHYMSSSEEELHGAKYQDLAGINPPQSMTMSRYAQV